MGRVSVRGHYNDGKWVRPYSRRHPSGGRGSGGPSRRTLLTAAGAVMVGWITHPWWGRFIQLPARVRIGRRTLDFGRSVIRFETETVELQAADDEVRRRIDFAFVVENREGDPLVLVSDQQLLRTSSGKLVRASGRTHTVPAKERLRISLAFMIPAEETPVELKIRSGRLTASLALSTES